MGGYKRFTDWDDAARQALVDAEVEARARNQGWIGTEHLMLGLIHRPDAPASEILADLGVQSDAVRLLLDRIIGRESTLGEEVGLTPRSRRVLDLAEQAAAAAGADEVGPEHLLLALAIEADGMAGQVLHQFGVDDSRIRRTIAGPTQSEWGGRSGD
jgi:ATP-dependent Clp protease ATP-binding subunit ClpC